MKRVAVFILLSIIGISSLGFCADDVGESAASVLSDSDASSLQITLGNFRVHRPADSGFKAFNLMFEIGLHNRSSSQKYDIGLPLDVFLQDEFGNSYLNKGEERQERLSGTSYSPLSLYPGENIYFSFVFQAPVAAAKHLVLEVHDQTKTVSRRLHYATRDIQNWDMIDEGVVLSDDDLKIVYPEARRVFCPGDTVFLKLEFSQNAGRPDHIYVILPNYILKDTEAKGQYEFQIAAETEEGDFQVIVLAEWGNRPKSQMISKTLFLNIKG